MVAMDTPIPILVLELYKGYKCEEVMTSKNVGRGPDLKNEISFPSRLGIAIIMTIIGLDTRGIIGAVTSDTIRITTWVLVGTIIGDTSETTYVSTCLATYQTE